MQDSVLKSVIEAKYLILELPIAGSELSSFEKTENAAAEARIEAPKAEIQISTHDGGKLKQNSSKIQERLSLSSRKPQSRQRKRQNQDQSMAQEMERMGGTSEEEDDEEMEMEVKEEEDNEEERIANASMADGTEGSIMRFQQNQMQQQGGVRRSRPKEEKERTKMRERHRRAITARILAGLRKHGNYNLRVRADINDVIAALAREAGWVVLPDGTTFPSKSPSSSSQQPQVTTTTTTLSLTHNHKNLHIRHRYIVTYIYIYIFHLRFRFSLLVSFERTKLFLGPGEF